MLTETSLADQRKSTRYRIGNNAYALLKQPQYKELGKIIDISQTGISFLCINQGDWDANTFAIDIIVGQEQIAGQSEPIVLKDIPLKPIVYCRDNDNDHRPTAMMRRCGVEFDQLTQDQRARLDLFILQQGIVKA